MKIIKYLFLFIVLAIFSIVLLWKFSQYTESQRYFKKYVADPIPKSVKITKFLGEGWGPSTGISIKFYISPEEFKSIVSSKNLDTIECAYHLKKWECYGGAKENGYRPTTMGFNPENNHAYYRFQLPD